MKKVIVLLVAFTLSIMLGVQNVFAEEAVEVIAEPSMFDNWVDVISDFASLKNFVVSSASVASLIALWKVRGAYKFLKSPTGIKKLEVIGFNIIKRFTDSPELVIKIANIVMELPLIKGILDNAKRKASMYEVDLLDKIINLEAKLAANVFEDNASANADAIKLLQKLRDEYEIIQPS